MHAAVQHLAERIDNDAAHSRTAFRQRVRSQQDHCPADRLAEGFADPDGMRTHQVQLQGSVLGGRNPHIAQFADAGRNRIGETVGCNHVLNYGTRPVHGGTCVRIEQNRTIFEDHLTQVIQRQGIPCDMQSFHSASVCASVTWPATVRKTLMYFSGKGAFSIFALTATWVLSPSASSRPSSVRSTWY